MHLGRLLSGWLVPAIIAQKIFIDQLSGYKALPSCAERPIHTIVKDMSLGCGDGKKTTSYGCFCSASSTHFVSLISKEVAKLCLPDTTTAVAQATSLFGSYCAIESAKNGTAVLSKTVSASTTIAVTTTSSSSASPTASPGAASTRPTLPASPSETGSSGANYPSHSRTLAYVMLGLGIVGVL
ncbi:hypothetical protein PG984_010330 [Apiospora sp. TS-2023a]